MFLAKDTDGVAKDCPLGPSMSGYGLTYFGLILGQSYLLTYGIAQTILVVEYVYLIPLWVLYMHLKDLAK
jgi:hypothetical protein